MAYTTGYSGNPACCKIRLPALSIAQFCKKGACNTADKNVISHWITDSTGTMLLYENRETFPHICRGP